jgi:hypothetical protein
MDGRQPVACCLPLACCTCCIVCCTCFIACYTCCMRVRDYDLLHSACCMLHQARCRPVACCTKPLWRPLQVQNRFLETIAFACNDAKTALACLRQVRGRTRTKRGEREWVHSRGAWRAISRARRVSRPRLRFPTVPSCTPPPSRGAVLAARGGLAIRLGRCWLDCNWTLPPPSARSDRMIFIAPSHRT